MGEEERQSYYVMMNSTEPKFVKKRWGSETWFANNDLHDYCGKILHIKTDCSTSMHFHLSKHETFFILEGALQVDWVETESGDVMTTIVKSGERMEMPKGVPHKLIAKDGDVKLIEASTFHRNADRFRVWK